MTEPDRDAERFRQLIYDLDRCIHGRHQKDHCWGCPDGNHGNPLIPPGTLIGTTVHGRIVVPPHAQRYDPRAWIVPDNTDLDDIARAAAHSQSLMRLGAATLAYYTVHPNEAAGMDAQNNLTRALDEHRRQFPEQP